MDELFTIVAAAREIAQLQQDRREIEDRWVASRTPFLAEASQASSGADQNP